MEDVVRGGGAQRFVGTHLAALRRSRGSVAAHMGAVPSQCKGMGKQMSWRDRARSYTPLISCPCQSAGELRSGTPWVWSPWRNGSLACDLRYWFGGGGSE